MSLIAIVTGASGQDGYMLIKRLLGESLEVHATVRTTSPGIDHFRLDMLDA